MTIDRLFLASASPRRRELLDLLGVQYEVRTADVKEETLAGESPAECVSRLALAKATAVHSTLVAAEQSTVLAADTLVAIDGHALGKPRDATHAAEILRRLSGRTHEVYTAVTLVSSEHRSVKVSRSEVAFRVLTAAEIDAYWATGEPVDKAGAYGIQGLGAVFIRELKGSYSGVMGLPLYETALLLDEAGVRYQLKMAGGDE